MPDTPVDIEAVRERLRTGPFSFVLNQVPALCTELEAARAFVKHCCLVAGIDPELPDEAMVQAFAGLRQDLKLNASMLSTQMDKATTALMDLEAAQAENATAMTKALSEAAECFDKYPSSCKWSAAQLRRLAEQAEQEKP